MVASMGVATIERWERAQPHQRLRLLWNRAPNVKITLVVAVDRKFVVLWRHLYQVLHSCCSCKIRTCCIKFSVWDRSKDPGEELRRPSSDPTPLGAPTLRAYAPRSGLRPLHRPPNQKFCIHPWAHPPSQYPGYAHDIRPTRAMTVIIVLVQWQTMFCDDRRKVGDVNNNQCRLDDRPLCD